MTRPPYSYNKRLDTRYTFVSSGKRNIEKVVDFTSTSVKNLYNLGFGDLLEDGSVDDASNSNNGDIIRVLATVIHILKEFTNIHFHVKVVFTGSTEERTALYRRILKMYFSEFSKDFVISGLIMVGNEYREVIFDPKTEIEYLAFFVRRIN